MEQIASYNFQNFFLEFSDGNFEDIYQRKKKEGNEKTIFSFLSSFRYNRTLNVTQTNAVSGLRNNDFGPSTAVDIDQRIDQNYRRLNIKYNNYLNNQDCKPKEAKSFIIGKLNNAIKQCLDLEIDNIGNIESGDGTLFFTKDDTVKPFSYNVLSTGEKEVVYILLDLYLRKDVYNNSISNICY